MPHAMIVDGGAQVAGELRLSSVDGTYGAGCTDRSGAWSLQLDPSSTQPLTNEPLSVNEADEGCVLTIVALRTADGAVLQSQSSLSLGEAYRDAPVGFGSPPLVYAIGKLDSTAFRSDFAVTLAFSVDPATLADDAEVALAVAVQNDSVPAPDYTIDVRRLSTTTDVHNIVQQANGTLTLEYNRVAATGYAIANGRLVTYPAIDTSFRASHAGMKPEISISELELTGLDLSTPQVRTLILANVAAGVRSYQVFFLVFRANTGA
ncbi:MAG: hypothetical protein JWN04_6066 [Myxococcaceae bacterium]|nr:hypothetical protein [Myxococcaceae bacterium]